jgi:hypothetical protein
MKNVMEARRSFLFLPIGLACILTYAFLQLGCGKSPTTPEPPVTPPKNKVRILVTVSANYVLSGLPATGTVTYQPQGEGATVKNLGEQADLYEIDEGTTKKTTITIEATGALKRVFKDVPLAGTKKFTTTVLELQDFYWEWFATSDSGAANLVYDGGCNTRWAPETMTVYINPPQHPTMKYNFTEEYKAAIRDTINRYQAASRGWIKSVTILDGDKRDIDYPPPVGEVWIFPSPPSDDTSGYIPQINAPYPPNSNAHVDSTTTWLINGLLHELDDAMIQVNQNYWPPIPNDIWDPLLNTCKGRDLYFAKWLPFLFSRPISDPYGYRIYHDREEEIGFTNGVSGTIEIGASVYAEDDTNHLSDSGVSSRHSELLRNSNQRNSSRQGERERIRN